MFGPLSISLADSIKSSRTLYKWVKPVANWYADAARYRQYGFKYDDLRESYSEWFTPGLLAKISTKQSSRSVMMSRGYDEPFNTLLEQTRKLFYLGPRASHTP
jgi:hypothetical protein